MNWSKIKNIMIIILVIINLFLLTDIALTRYMSQALPKGTGDSFESLLGKSGITIEKRLVPRHYETRRIIDGEYYDIDTLTEIFIGERVKYISNGESIIAPSDDKKLVITGKSFEYTTLHESIDKNGKDIINALKGIGISMTGAYFDEDTGLVKVVLDKEKVEGIYLDVALSEEGDIAYARGIWPRLTVKGTDEKVSVIEAVNEICDTLPSGSNIVDIEKIYVYSNNGGEPVIDYGWIIYNQGRGYVVS